MKQHTCSDVFWISCSNQLLRPFTEQCLTPTNGPEENSRSLLHWQLPNVSKICHVLSVNSCSWFKDRHPVTPKSLVKYASSPVHMITKMCTIKVKRFIKRRLTETGGKLLITWKNQGNIPSQSGLFFFLFFRNSWVACTCQRPSNLLSSSHAGT